MKSYDYNDFSGYPGWFLREVQELEQDLADGWISFTEFNQALDEMERDMYASEEDFDRGYL